MSTSLTGSKAEDTVWTFIDEFPTVRTPYAIICYVRPISCCVLYMLNLVFLRRL